MKIPIGIDFGTNYTYIGFVHGTDAEGNAQVRELVPARYVSRGIPSVYWNNGKTELFGIEAVKKNQSQPNYGVTSVKSKLMQAKITLGNAEYTPLEIVRRMMTYFLETAEEVLREQYALDPEGLDVVLTFPVDFEQPQLLLLRHAMESVKLKSGTPVFLKYVIQEPVASAVRFLGIRSDPGSCAAVFDLGGGTLDIAVVRYEQDGVSPYKVIDQGGSREIGGDRWDERMTELLSEAFTKETGNEPSAIVRRKISEKARETKEELSSTEITDSVIDHEGDYLELSVTRADFERKSQDLTDQAVSLLKEILNRQKYKIQNLILTGGGSRMPQIQNAIRAILPEGTEMRCFNPEKSIAEGAAVLSDLLKLPSVTTGEERRSAVSNLAPHGYGIILNVPQRNNEPMIRIFFKKNDSLTASGYSNTKMGDLPEEKRRISLYTICETDVLEEGTDPYEKGKYVLIDGIPYTALYQGREVLDVILTRPEAVKAGTPVSETLSLDESMLLRFSAEDTINQMKISREIDMKGKNVSF